MENDAKYDIICSKCLGSKHREKVGCSEEMYGQCTSCTRFYLLSNNLKDWLVYYYRQLKQFYYIKKYNIVYNIYKLIYKIFLSKSVFFYYWRWRCYTLSCVVD